VTIYALMMCQAIAVALTKPLAIGQAPPMEWQCQVWGGQTGLFHSLAECEAFKSGPAKGSIGPDRTKVKLECMKKTAPAWEPAQ
jgi:hypothetical protein